MNLLKIKVDKKKPDLITQILANIPKPSVGISTAEFVKKK